MEKDRRFQVKQGDTGVQLKTIETTTEAFTSLIDAREHKSREFVVRTFGGVTELIAATVGINELALHFPKETHDFKLLFALMISSFVAVFLGADGFRNMTYKSSIAKNQQDLILDKLDQKKDEVPNTSSGSDYSI